MLSSSTQNGQYSLPSPYESLSPSDAIKTNHHPSYVQNHQLSSLGLPVHLRQPMHLTADPYRSDPTHEFSRFQIEFVERARTLILLNGSQAVLGSTTIDASGLIESLNGTIHDAKDVQTWVKIFLSQFDTSLSDRTAFALLLVWYMRVSLSA